MFEHFVGNSTRRSRRYSNTLRSEVNPGGKVIIGTFAADGPTTCSGLPVVRYGADRLATAFGEAFEILAGAARSTDARRLHTAIHVGRARTHSLAVLGRMAPVDRIELPEHDIFGIRAPNPGPFTLTGTNSWIVGRVPAWLVDPGPDIDSHVAALAEELDARGGLGGIALTHNHPDHAAALEAISGRFPRAPVAASNGAVDVTLGEGSLFGPLAAVRTPGHSADHLAFVAGRAGFTGDAVLGEGSVFINPDPNALASYLAALRGLRELDLEVLCPGHGPPVHDPDRKLKECIDHRLDRERRLLAALAAGKRCVAELLDDVWADAPAALRPAATVTLAAHLDKLADEGRLPDGVERPAVG